VNSSRRNRRSPRTLRCRRRSGFSLGRPKPQFPLITDIPKLATLALLAARLVTGAIIGRGRERDVPRGYANVTAGLNILRRSYRNLQQPRPSACAGDRARELCRAYLYEICPLLIPSPVTVTLPVAVID
jgi:hypothetical protein